MVGIPEELSETDVEIVQEIIDSHGFPGLTQTQAEAFEGGALDKNNTLLVAETGNGKTLVAEAVANKALQNNKTVAYLVPSRALLGEKRSLIEEWVDDSTVVRESNGYTKADVMVATFESFYEAVIRGYAGRYDTVILDDFHEIYSGHRGPNIEKAISAILNQEKHVFAMSATLGNPDVIARWLNADLVYSTEKRAVPIDERPIGKANDSYAKQIAGIISHNREKGPFLVFNDTTSNAKARAEGLADELSFDSPDVNYRERVKEEIDTGLSKAHKELIRLLNNGIAYHHAKLEDGVKDLIEEETEKGNLKCVCCTTSLSYGFDSPVQTVITADLKRWTPDIGRHFIGVYEYVQWIGRAGRDADKYDVAYAFTLYDDDEAKEKFQFDTPVEEKDLEDVTSHVEGRSAFRWLTLELVKNGWETDAELFDFLQHTLYWVETVDAQPAHEQPTIGETPAAAIKDRLVETLEWLETRGLIQRPVGQPQSDAVRFKATPLGASAVEYEHSNWFDDDVTDVLELVDWLADQGDDLTPEALIEYLAENYYQCDAKRAPTEDTFTAWTEKHELNTGSEGYTAALISWYWCSGASLSDLEDLLDMEDLASIPRTARNISQALDSLTHLYKPAEAPSEPEWHESLQQRVKSGVRGDDLYLIKTVDYFGRRRYNDLKDQLNRMGSGADWDPGPEAPVVERLSKLLASRNNEDLFLDGVKATSGIGSSISENILESVRAWDPDDVEHTPVPFAKSILKEHGPIIRHHQQPDSAEASENETEFKTTSLTDF